MAQQRNNIRQCPENIETQNLTFISEFYLMELTDNPELKPILFGLFLSMYLIAVLGNLLIVLAVSNDPKLHTPMYFFICNLSLADIGFISTTVPKVMVNIKTHRRSISYVACLTQMSAFAIFGCVDDMLLAVMAYDRFIAICHPLHYPIIITPKHCVLLVLSSFLVGILDSQLHNLVITQLPYLKDVEIANFFCDPSKLLNMTCYNYFINDIVEYFTGAVFGFFPILGILYSYYKIVLSVLKISSSEAKFKAFSTCVSHLSVVCLFYGTGLGVYLSPAFSSSHRKDLIAEVMYTVVTPTLNPFIYSLRNRDIKGALRRLHLRTN
ncbi:olfactory receptor 7E24-like [Alexandromys fortis]|uniref:olfactory receptor 7E24-like n=1 Tax=Alexandromys fortis TaxID=100897 RepID=UPI0021520B7C|nr:olfactory receptor 7E24-like [Microtus fortis]